MSNVYIHMKVELDLQVQKNYPLLKQTKTTFFLLAIAYFISTA